MSAKRPRVSVVLDADVVETLQRVGAVQGRSVSRIIGEILRELEPGLRKVADLGEAFDRLTAEQASSLKRAVHAADADLGAPLEDALGTVLQVLGRLDELATDAANPPPLGNTGVR